MRLPVLVNTMLGCSISCVVGVGHIFSDDEASFSFVGASDTRTSWKNNRCRGETLRDKVIGYIVKCDGNKAWNILKNKVVGSDLCNNFGNERPEDTLVVWVLESCD